MNDSIHLADCIRVNVGDFTFQEAFDRTGRILNITGKRAGARKQNFKTCQLIFTDKSFLQLHRPTVVIRLVY